MRGMHQNEQQQEQRQQQQQLGQQHGKWENAKTKLNITSNWKEVKEEKCDELPRTSPLKRH